MKETVIGVIGVGVVGGAVAQAFSRKFTVLKYDKHKEIGTLANLAANATMTFVCVPTSTCADWSQDQSPLLEVLTRLEAMKFQGPIVVKCTVTPGTMDKMRHIFPDLKLVHNPEFLTEAKPLEDFESQENVLLSSDSNDALREVGTAYNELMSNATVHLFFDFKATELAKYIHNTFLAVKVGFFNEIYDYACDIAPRNPDLFETAMRGAVVQGKLGPSHLKVPGPDGKRGFGGMCFPKDTKALSKVDKKCRLRILSAAILSNLRIRGE